jgi:drug/metabolite transporter (DMT)-like permease
MSGDKLSASQIALLVAYAGAMAVGQFLFKAAALRSPAGPLADRLGGLLLDAVFWAALVLYAALALLWVWILTFTPLSRAYPFVAIAFALTPLLGGLFFGEPLTLRLLLGLAVVLCGLVIIVG